jgi:hypothetical protein
MRPKFTPLIPVAFLLSLFAAAVSHAAPADVPATLVRITHPGDTVPIRDRSGDFLTGRPNNLIDLRDPSAITQEVEYDPVTNRYLVTERIGDGYFRSPTYMTFEEYSAYREKQRQQAYFDQLRGVSSGDRVGLSALEDPIEAVDIKNSLVDRLFGGTDINIQTRGNVDLTIGYDYRRTANPAFTLRQQAFGNPDFR